jgi:putative MATE family efflux protein
MNPQNRQEMLRSGSINKTLLKLSTPAIIAMLAIALYNIVDTMYIGLLKDTAAIGAATVMFPVFMIISSIGLMFGVGAGSAISRRLGAGEAERANRIAATAYYSCITIGILFSVFGVINIRKILQLFGATETIMEKAVIYGSIIIGGSIFQMLNMCLNNIVRAEGASTYSGRAMIMGAVLNVILDPIFMFVLDLGIAGAAWATITSQLISNLYLLRFFLKKKGVIRIGPKHFSFSGENYAEIMKIGVPTFVRQVLLSVSMGVMNNSASLYGDGAIAAIGVVTRLLALVTFVVFGLGQGFQPIAGFNYGAKQYARVHKSFRITIIWSSSFSILVSGLFLLFAPLLIKLFSQDPEVIAIGTRALRFSSSTLMLLGFQNTASIFFQALGKGRETAFLAMARQGLFLITLLLILPRFLGLDGIIFSQPLADLLTLVVTLVLLAANSRNLAREEKELK